MLVAVTVLVGIGIIIATFFEPLEVSSNYENPAISSVMEDRFIASHISIFNAAIDAVTQSPQPNRFPRICWDGTQPTYFLWATGNGMPHPRQSLIRC